MRVADLVNKTTEPKMVLTETLKRIQETQDHEFSKSMTGKELLEWVKSL